MNKDDIKLSDWGRIFLGDVPAEFIIEAVIRMIFVYIILVFSLRLLGKRMESMLSRGEMVTLVTLGASVGVAIHTPERGVLPSVIVMLVIISLQALQAYFTSRNSKAERLLLDQISTLVENSRMIIPEMKKSRITRERLLAALRLKGLKSLGQVQRVYFESKGVFTILTYLDQSDKPGLCLLPDDDSAFRSELNPAAGFASCHNCGHTVNGRQENSGCQFCGKKQWEGAVTGS